MRVFDANWMQIEEYLRRDDRIVLEVITQLDARRIREALPEGMMGGAYARPDEDMQVIWDAGVAEVREVIETGWLA